MDKFIDNQKNFSFIVMGVISFVGLLIKISFGSNTTDDGTDGPASSTVYGYGIVAFSILSGIFLSFALASGEKIEQSGNQLVAFLKVLITHSLQPILLFIILLWIITINTNYYTKINQGRVTNEFFRFSTISNILIFIQVIILFLFLNEREPIKRNQMSQILYILASLNLVFAAMMNIVLKYFSTDG
jgi:hypothetical protein